MTLHELAERFEVPGATLGVYSAGRYDETAAGVLNRRTGVATTPDSLFQIGSVTKVWTAALVLGLVEDGRIALGDLVVTHVPEVRQLGEVADQLTVRHLLNHTSGLPGDWFPDTGRGDDCLARLVPLMAEVPPTHPVGALTSYSNSAFSLAGLLVERVLGATWDVALRSRVVEPLGLEHTVTLAEDALLHRAAVGHLGAGADQKPAPIWQLPRACGPAGLICSSVADVVRFGRTFLASNGVELLSPESVAAMTTLTASLPETGGTAPLGFGLGWGLARWDGHRVLAHDGGTLGQAAALRVLPDDGIVLALCSNGGQWTPFRDAVFGEVLAAIGAPMFPAPPEPPGQSVEVSGLADYVGRYERPGVSYLITAEGDRLVVTVKYLDELEKLASGENPPLDLLAAADDRFLLRESESAPWMPVAFLRTTAGDVDYVHAGGRAARRVANG